ncbi:hypothetical protein D9619_009344 [Psilocybe cf. subviscida]|uniref:DUF6533 domain-containing protein n=1 Tax=Psilocybe cf. subviscida TaxID=2480587 RepID=A0A8H5BU32_9AGAR|nr:hypothetical protein D9619_009344 [Psilocybe cf. subviscida]
MMRTSDRNPSHFYLTTFTSFSTCPGSVAFLFCDKGWQLIGYWEMPLPTMITPTPSTYATLATSDDNPFAHLALVPAHEARERITCSYALIGSLSVFVWDILCHLQDDYQILSKHRITLPTFVYFFSRLFTLLYLTGNTVTQTIPVGHCSIAIRVVTLPVVVAVPASEFLLFLHVRAIYATERIVVWFFTLLWLSTLVNAALSAASISGMNIGPSSYCTAATTAYATISMVIPLVNDTLLFIALVARIMGTSTQHWNTTYILKDRFKTALFGASIPRLAKNLLQNGQQYFLATVIVNLAALILYHAGGGNPSLGYLTVMLMNLMASRLYRKTKLTRYEELNVSSLPPSRPILFAQSSSRTEEPTVLDSVSGTMASTAHSIEGSYNPDRP